MSGATDTELDPREELAALVASTRALLEQYEASGADLLPVADPAAVAAFLAGHAAPARPAARHDPARPDAGAQGRPAFRAPGAAQGAFSPPAPRWPAEGAAHAPAPHPPAAHSPAAHPSTAHPHENRAPAHEAPPAMAARAAQPHPPEHEPHEARRPGTRAPAAQAAPVAGLQGGGAEGDDRRMRLALLAEEVRPCQRCPLCESRTQTVFARGNPFAEVCFVGEGPGAEEDAQGEPFVGPAGQLLDRMIVAMGYRRDDVYICNIVKCRPPKNRKPEPNEIEACSPYLREQLTLVKPKVLVALGATAVTGLLGTTEGITRLRGKWKLYKGAIPVMPTFHPAYLLRSPAAKRDVWNDLQEVMKHLGKPVPKSGAGRGDA